MSTPANPKTLKPDNMSKKDASNRATAETITPLKVPIKNKGIDGDRLQRRHHFGIIILICSVIGLVAFGVWFLLYLSKIPAPPQQAPKKQSVTKPEVEKKPVALPEAPPSDVNPEQLALDKEKAEQKLADFLETKNELERIGAPEWGAETFSEIAEFGREADSLLIKKEYIPASAKYDRAVVLGGKLAERAGEALLRLLEEGRSALNDGKGAVAQSKYTVALMIDPTNPSALHGLKRAKTIETVIQLAESGRQHERDNALSLAQADYRKALGIDPDFTEAQQALNRVTDQMKEEQFSRLMSAGMTALHNNDYTLARTRLLKAKSLKPESREVSEALFQVNQALRLARINQLQNDAQTAEQSQDWQRALKSYLAVLDIDKNLQFAVQGKRRALEQIRIAKRFQFFLGNPKVLESDKQLNNAVLLLNEAKEISPQGSKLTARINELEGLVAIAQTPVTVTIESDNLTQVAVYKVGKLGRFSLHKLKLRPGTYTVVGARDGYKDVRQKIVVKPGQQPLRVTIKCRVKI
jgi:hypothetical protein